MLKAVFTALSAAVLVAACAASSHVLVGTARPPISPDQVKIYLSPPPVAYEEIAIIDASSRGSGSFTDQKKLDAAIARLKREAASLGANGVLLEGTEDRTVGSVGVGSGGTSFSGNSAYGGGIGLGGSIRIKSAKGIAIFVKP